MSDEDDSDDSSDDDSSDDEDKNIESIWMNKPSFVCYKTKIDSNEAAEQLANALKDNTHLKELSLDLGSNVNDRKYAENLATAIANAKLTHLRLEWHHICKDDDFFIARCLIGAARQSPTIQHLGVYKEDKEGIGEIASCIPHLQSLHMKGGFVAGNIELLCEGLQRASTLTSLHLSYNNFKSRDDLLKLLSQALADYSSITTLCIHGNGAVDNESVKAFVEHWHHDSQIHTLAFTHTKIKAEGAMILIQAASSHPAMESLSIAQNRCIGYEGLANIALEMPNVVLKSLNVAWGTWFACALFGESSNEKGKVVGGLFVQGVSANTHLVELDVSGNRFGAAGQGVEEALAFYTLRNKYSPLMVSHLHLPASVWCHCFAKNGNNASFIFHFLREQPMLWRVCRKNNKRQRTH